jgi:hypothetical protein
LRFFASGEWSWKRSKRSFKASTNRSIKHGSLGSRQLRVVTYAVIWHVSDTGKITAEIVLNSNCKWGIADGKECEEDYKKWLRNRSYELGFQVDYDFIKVVSVDEQSETIFVEFDVFNLFTKRRCLPHRCLPACWRKTLILNKYRIFSLIETHFVLIGGRMECFRIKPLKYLDSPFQQFY